MSLPARAVASLCDETDADWAMTGYRQTLDPVGMADGAMRLLADDDSAEAGRIRARWRLVLDILQKGIAGV